MLLFLTVGGLIFNDESEINPSNIVVDTEEIIPLNPDKENTTNIINTPNVNDIDDTQSKVASINSNVSENENQDSTSANSSEKTLKDDILVTNPSPINNTVAKSASDKQNNKTNSDERQ